MLSSLECNAILGQSPVTSFLRKRHTSTDRLLQTKDLRVVGRSSFWINWYKDMVDAGILELGDEFDMKCLWFCYSRLLQKELENVKEHWNSHYIRKSRHDTVAGVPDILYFLPESVGFVDCVVAVPHDKIKQVQSECEVDHDDNNELYNEYFIHIMEANDWAFPENEKEALSLFQKFKLLQTP